MAIELRQWQAMGEQLTAGAYRLFVADSAMTNDAARDLAPLLLIHGFPTSSWDWHHQWHALAKEYRLIAPDMLGFGFSDKPKKHRYRIMEQADLIEDLLLQKEMLHCHVLAHDYGDTVAQELLARDADRARQRITIDSVCFLNGGLFPETHRARLIQKMLLSPAGGLLTRLMSRRTLERNLRAVFGENSPPSEVELDTFWQLLKINDGQLVMNRLLTYMTDRIEHRERWVGALQKTRKPIGLINGSADPVSGAHMVTRYRELVNDKHIVELPAIGHYPQLEAPQLVLEHFMDFMQMVREANK